MKKNTAVAIIVAAVVIVGGIAAYFLFKPAPPPPPPPMQVQAPPPPPPKPEVRQVIEAPPVPPPLPTLGESDKFVLDALAGLVGNKSLMKVFRTDRIIRNIVATIDNLPQRRAPMNVMPIERAEGWLVTEGKENGLTISPKNAARYAPYMKVAEAIDAKKLVGLYVRLYPLFQEAYEELGYPKKYFNDRLIVAIDDLLAAPNIKEPVALIQPSVYYKYADPDLEARSIGQRILMRIGSKNEAIMKAKLREIREELKLHMRERRMEKGK
ncbi:DUF3014 domain-containing protein [Candidatus Ferrigenium straubiae]|jgi:hypothetical protein|uniref:DUF3014 domain-containing protein n=1 Tax=Candidatus Ferrigenium straubiae TaxID=2919506 RepID=UPI003F4A9432